MTNIFFLSDFNENFFGYESDDFNKKKFYSKSSETYPKKFSLKSDEKKIDFIQKFTFSSLFRVFEIWSNDHISKNKNRKKICFGFLIFSYRR